MPSSIWICGASQAEMNTFARSSGSADAGLVQVTGDRASVSALGRPFVSYKWPIRGPSPAGGEEEEKAGRILTSPGLPLVALGTSTSLDELSIGLSIGDAHLAVTAVIVAFALQAFIAAQLGRAIGAKMSERLRERAEQVSGVALILLGGYLIAEQPRP
jgi:hypothetical protein